MFFVSELEKGVLEPGVLVHFVYKYVREYDLRQFGEWWRCGGSGVGADGYRIVI